MRCALVSGVGWPIAAAAAAISCAAQDTTTLEGERGSSPALAAPAGCASVGGSGVLASGSAALSVEDRSLVGSPAGYVPDASLRSREAELVRSQRARRAAAWEIAARVLAPVRLSGSTATPTPELRAWQSWHNKDDVTRIFRRLYAGLTPEQRAGREPLAPEAIAEAWAWNDGAVADFEEWSTDRLAAYRDALDSAARVAGLGGIARVAYAPRASLHWLDSYAEVLGCRRSAPQGGPSEPAPTVEASADCGLPPAPPPACLAGQFAPASVLVKASWARLDAGEPLPAFDTSAASLAAKLSPSGGFDWGPGDRDAAPGEGELYTLELPNGNRFGLTGLHIMSKELEHWFWVSLWWSDEPDTDFGADRPAGLSAPFDHYKLCTVVWFDEGDEDTGGGFEADAPSLAAALASTRASAEAPTWCSNPYIERGAGNAATNCLGCHQHAGTDLGTREILAASDAASGSGRRLSRASFPADYVFALRRGDDIGAMLVETEDHYAPSPAAAGSPRE